MDTRYAYELELEPFEVLQARRELEADALHEAIRPRNFDPATVEVVGFMDTHAPALEPGGGAQVRRLSHQEVGPK